MILTATNSKIKMKLSLKTIIQMELQIIQEDKSLLG